MNVIVGEESWIQYYELHRKVSNRVWLTKNTRSHCNATRITSAKKVMYAILYTTKGLAIQVPIPKASP